MRKIPNTQNSRRYCPTLIRASSLSVPPDRGDASREVDAWTHREDVLALYIAVCTSHTRDQLDHNTRQPRGAPSPGD
eukprot:1221390-Prymnesium_polylepis.1